jgi:hypothetical protein
VVDDRDVVLGQPVDEALGPPVEPRRPGEFDQGAQGAFPPCVKALDKERGLDFMLC